MENAGITFADIPHGFVEKWQEIANLLAEILHVPAALIMKADNGFMEVFVSSDTPKNPYHVGDRERWHGLYCERVISTQRKLAVPDATADPEWNANPDIKLGMIAYLGYPVNFSDQRPFGTICVLDSRERVFTGSEQALLRAFRDVIEADLAVIEREMLLDVTGRIARVGGWQLDARSMTVSWTPEVFRIHEISADQAPPLEGALEFWHPEDRPILAAAIDRALHHGQPYDLELRFITAKGRHLYARTVCKPVVVNGTTVKLQGIFQDITERKQAQSEFEAIFDMSLALICIADIHTATFTRVNPAMCIALGYGEDELLERTFLDFIHPDDIEPTRRVVDESLKRGEKVIAFENRYRCKDGSYRWLMWNSHPRIEQGLTYSVAIDITERRRAEEALRESERSLRKAQEIAQVGSWAFDLGAGTVFASEQTRRIYGLGEERITIKAVQAIPLDSYRPLLDRALQDLLHRSAPYDVEFEIRRPSDGEIRYIHSIAEYEADRNMVVGTLQDITERKAAERARWQSENRFRSFVENANDIVYALSPEGVFTYVSPNWFDYVGEPATEALGKSFEPYVHADDLHLCRDFLRKVLQTGEKQSSVEYRVRHHDGGWRWHLSNGSPMRDQNGAVTGYVGIARDVTERKEAQRAMAAERERLAVTLRSIGDGVITAGIDGKIEIMNTVAEQLTGWTQEEARGMPLESVFVVVDETTRERREHPVAAALQKGGVVELSGGSLLLSRDGAERVVADSGAPIRNAANQITGVVLVFRDETERRAMIETMNRASRLESLGVLAGGIAHDFNNLLGGIFGYIDMAAESASDPRVERYMNKALGAIDRARDLTRQLLTFAKGGAPVKTVESLFPLVEETAMFALSGSNVSCTTTADPDLWLCSYDKNQIGQVIDNLVINAVQAMPDGGTIEIRAENVTLRQAAESGLAPGRYVRLSIADQGIGMPRTILSKIFDPFYSTKAQGQGLGLATCYSIVTRHGGAIEAQSEPGEGSTFYVYLPAAAEGRAETAAHTETPHRGSGLIVVMDDEEIMRETISDMLHGLGYAVHAVAHGDEAVSFFRRERDEGRAPAAMIFDLTVPGAMGGVQAVRDVREAGARMPVFVASGYADDPAMASPEKFGFTASIRKPFRKAELARMLERHLGHEA